MIKILLACIMISFSFYGHTVEVGTDYIKYLNKINSVKSIQQAKDLSKEIESKLQLKKNKVHLSLLAKRFDEEAENLKAKDALAEYRRVMTLFLTANSLREFNPMPSYKTIEKTQNMMWTLGVFILAFFAALFWSLRQRSTFLATRLIDKKQIIKLGTRIEELESLLSSREMTTPVEIQQPLENSDFIHPVEFVENFLIEKLNFKDHTNLKINEDDKVEDSKFAYSSELADSFITKYFELVYGMQSILESGEMQLNFKKDEGLFSYDLSFSNVKLSAEDLEKQIEVAGEKVVFADYLKEIEVYFKREQANLKIKNLKKSGVNSVQVSLELIENSIIQEDSKVESHSANNTHQSL